MNKFLVPKLVAGTPAGLTLIGVVLLFLVVSGLVPSGVEGVAFSQPLFAPPVNLGPKINTASHDFDPFLTFDGKKLFFVSLRDNGLHLWFAEWTDTGWTNPRKLGPQINAGANGKWSPSVSPDGQKLYYVDDSRQGFFWDIWVSTWDSSFNDWGTPVNLGPPVNTTGAERSAHLGPDGRHLYFDSDGSGRCGIYVSEWNGTNWLVPTHIPAASCAVDAYPTITADGRWFFFDRYVTGSKKNVFVSVRTDSGWGAPINLLPQIGDSSWTPFIVPSGDSLFFNSNRGVGGFGGSDLWISRRLQRGDLNMDGELTAADVVLELNKVFLGEPYPAPEAVGDMNCDSGFTPADAVLLLQVVYLNVPPEC